MSDFCRGYAVTKWRDSMTHCAVEWNPGFARCRFGITPFQGYGVSWLHVPRVAPWAMESRTVGATEVSPKPSSGKIGAAGHVAAKRRDSIAQGAAKRSPGLVGRRFALALKGRDSYNALKR